MAIGDSCGFGVPTPDYVQMGLLAAQAHERAAMDAMRIETLTKRLRMMWEDPDGLAEVDLVLLEHACPKCGERQMDLLELSENDDRCTCGTCGTVYDPAGGKAVRP